MHTLIHSRVLSQEKVRHVKKCMCRMSTPIVCWWIAYLEMHSFLPILIWLWCPDDVWKTVERFLVPEQHRAVSSLSNTTSLCDSIERSVFHSVFHVVLSSALSHRILCGTGVTAFSRITIKVWTCVCKCEECNITFHAAAANLCCSDWNSPKLTFHLLHSPGVKLKGNKHHFQRGPSTGENRLINILLASNHCLERFSRVAVKAWGGKTSPSCIEQKPASLINRYFGFAAI